MPPPTLNYEEPTNSRGEARERSSCRRFSMPVIDPLRASSTMPIP